MVATVTVLHAGRGLKRLWKFAVSFFSYSSIIRTCWRWSGVLSHHCHHRSKAQVQRSILRFGTQGEMRPAEE